MLKESAVFTQLLPSADGSQEEACLPMKMLQSDPGPLKAQRVSIHHCERIPNPGSQGSLLKR